MAHEFKPQTAEILYRALSGADGHSAIEPLDDATLLHVPGRSGLAGTYQGRDAILRLLERMTDLTGGTLRFAPSHTFTADEQIIVVCGHASADRHTKQLDTGAAYVVLFRNGRVRQMWLAHQHQADFDDFWY